MSTSYLTAVPSPADDAAVELLLDRFLSALVHPDVQIRDDRLFSPQPCPQCGDPVALTVARVYGQPRPSQDSFEGPEEGCCECTPVLIADALQARADDTVIVVEVAA